MKRLTLNFSLLSCILFFCVTNKLSAQVTIGSGIEPEKAALLEIKTKAAISPLSVTDATNVTSEAGGLGLPRVFLVNRSTLEPFIPKDSDWDNNVGKVKEKHAGLIVYNIKVSPDTEKTEDLLFAQGMYIWDGNRWNPINEDSGKYFYIPSFNLKFTLGQVGKVQYLDLYKEYKKQFTNDTSDINSTFKSNNTSIKTVPSPKNGRLYSEKELDYVVTYYDKTVMTINGIDNNGLMEYKIDNLDLTPDTFMNVVFVVK
ncbi:MAG: hypothetical protein ACK5M3_13360 [Dysgonomonas sp.]